MGNTQKLLVLKKHTKNTIQLSIEKVVNQFYFATIKKYMFNLIVSIFYSPLALPWEIFYMHLHVLQLKTANDKHNGPLYYYFPIHNSCSHPALFVMKWKTVGAL